ncbi:PREDICTED: AAA-ATPase At3g28600-like isoform X2 [Camelina sativa]|uniref:AAA-ATPase At3g28600-like isoform X1 n=1 Tax=Camelina sativa TaxID=90675 RepID=A0ABM0ZEC3_CAMSA|nr:PREDICTED: AAA-ATPase At3g28600-like isoform X1 [Camelina sativa]XP_010514565.1 PREDICTED: AAA-ATPase At3g28600-like isoform X2 [Camelina sativa]
MMMMGNTFGSSLASLFFLLATVQQIFPNHLNIAIKEFLISTIQQLSFFQKISDRFINFFSPYVEINFSQYEDYQFNHAFSAIETYLGAKATDKAKHLRASQVRESKGLVLKRDETKVRDEYEGVNVWWEIETDSNGYRTFKLTFHRRSRDIVTDSYIQYVVEEGKSIEAKNKKMKLFTNNPSSQWESSKASLWRYIDFEHPANFETLAMDPKKKEEILSDLVAFSIGKEYYKKIGKAWKRGYLLYGPPGTGKSTMIAAMANLLNYSIYDLELTAIQNNSELRKLLTATSSKSIIVIEDIDCSLDLTGKRKKNESYSTSLRKDRGKSNAEDESFVTLSGLLNFIDGVWSACGQERIIVFTTNHLEKLDPALIRRGRMDMHIELSYCTFEAFKILAKNYLDLDSHPLFKKIESLMKETKIAPADVAENLMKKNREIDADGSLKDLIQALEKRKKVQRDQVDEHKDKKRNNIRNAFRMLF